MCVMHVDPTGIHSWLWPSSWLPMINHSPDFIPLGGVIETLNKNRTGWKNPSLFGSPTTMAGKRYPPKRPALYIPVRARLDGWHRERNVPPVIILPIYLLGIHNIPPLWDRNTSQTLLLRGPSARRGFETANFTVDARFANNILPLPLSRRRHLSKEPPLTARSIQRFYC